MSHIMSGLIWYCCCPCGMCNLPLNWLYNPLQYFWGVLAWVNMIVLHSAVDFYLFIRIYVYMRWYVYVYMHMCVHFCRGQGPRINLIDFTVIVTVVFLSRYVARNYCSSLPSYVCKKNLAVAAKLLLCLIMGHDQGIKGWAVGITTSSIGLFCICVRVYVYTHVCVPCVLTLALCVCAYAWVHMHRHTDHTGVYKHYAI